MRPLALSALLLASTLAYSKRDSDSGCTAKAVYPNGDEFERECIVEGEGKAQRLIFTTNVEDHVTAGIDNPLTFAVSPVSGEPMAFVDVRNGLKARLNRPVFYQLVDLAMENEDTGALEVWSDGVAFSLAVLEGDDAS